VSEGSPSHHTLKYGHESCGTWNQKRSAGERQQKFSRHAGRRQLPALDHAAKEGKEINLVSHIIVAGMLTFSEPACIVAPLCPSTVCVSLLFKLLEAKPLASAGLVTPAQCNTPFSLATKVYLLHLPSW
jgi:hypothetical protein